MSLTSLCRIISYWINIQDKSMGKFSTLSSIHYSSRLFGSSSRRSWDLLAKHVYILKFTIGLFFLIYLINLHLLGCECSQGSFKGNGISLMKLKTLKEGSSIKEVLIWIEMLLIKHKLHFHYRCSPRKMCIGSNKLIIQELSLLVHQIQEYLSSNLCSP